MKPEQLFIKLADKSPVPAPKGWRGIIQLATQRSIAYSNRGVMHMLRGNVSGATEDFQTAIERKGRANLSTPKLIVDAIEADRVIVRVGTTEIPIELKEQ